MKHKLLPLVAFLLIVPVQAADWTGFRGATGTAVSPETGLPTTWDKEKGIRYKVALPGRGLSNPVVSNGRVYVTACSGYRERRLHVLCLDEKTGEKLWERQFTATGNTACHPTTNMAAPTPVADQNAVYALFATGDVVALGREGDLLWYRSLVGDYPTITNQVGMASSPVLAGKVLVLPMDNYGDSFVAGLDIATGKNVWKVKRDRSINWVSPVVIAAGDAPTVLYQTGDEATALDPATGKVRWKYKSDLTTIPSPVAGDGKVFLTGSQLQAIRPSQDGAEPEKLWESKLGSREYASPVYYGGRLYGMTAVALVCFDANTGKELYKQRLAGNFDASPVVADGKLYAVNRKGQTHVVDITGDKAKVVATNDLGDEILATPAIANGCIYLRSDKFLYCIGSPVK